MNVGFVQEIRGSVVFFFFSSDLPKIHSLVYVIKGDDRVFFETVNQLSNNLIQGVAEVAPFVRTKNPKT